MVSVKLNYHGRMFTSSLAEEAKQLQEEIESIKDKIDDPMICAKIRHFVYAPREIQEMFKADSGEYRLVPKDCLY